MNENELIRVLKFCLIKLQTLKLHELAESRSLIILTDEIGYFDVSTRPMLSLLPVAYRFRVSKQAPDNFNNVIILVYFFCSRESTTYWSTFDAFWLINSSDTDNRQFIFQWGEITLAKNIEYRSTDTRKENKEVSSKKVLSIIAAVYICRMIVFRPTWYFTMNIDHEKLIHAKSI